MGRSCRTCNPPATGWRPVLAALIACAACKGSGDPPAEPPTAPVVVGDAGPGNAAPADAIEDARIWPELAEFPTTDPLRVITLPARPDIPRFDVGGPVIAGDVAVVSSSQLGFAAIDWRRGALMWTKPAGLHVAPPLVHAGSVILIGACLSPPDLDDAGSTLLGCLRVVTEAGVDQSYTAIHGRRLDAFAGEPGPQAVWPDGERAVRWRRGEQAVSVDLITGVARPASPEPPPLRIVYGKRTWDITRTEQQIVARERGKVAWQTRRPYTALLGAVYLPDLAPMLRAMWIHPFAGISEMNLLDIDATGSLAGSVSFPIPALSVLGHAIDAAGATAIAVRMDSSLQHDFIAGYAASALLLYVHPLPEIPRADPVGVAIAPDGVLVFHDGDTFTVLPPLSMPATAPGIPARPSQNSTP